MEQTVFNPAQMKILQMMSYIKTPLELVILKMFSLYILPKRLMRGLMSCAIMAVLLIELLTNYC